MGIPIFPAATKGGGQCFIFPDVCKTPAGPSVVPIPYPNIGMFATSKKCADKVKIQGKPTFTMGSEVPSSSGDEPGVAKGVMSSTNMGKCTPKVGSANVKAQGQKVVRLTSMMSQNKGNHPAGLMVAPSQAKVIVT